MSDGIRERARTPTFIFDLGRTDADATCGRQKWSLAALLLSLSLPSFTP